MMMGIGYEFKILYTVVGYTLSISDNSFCVKMSPLGRENREGPVVGVILFWYLKKKGFEFENSKSNAFCEFFVF